MDVLIYGNLFLDIVAMGVAIASLWAGRFFIGLCVGVCAVIGSLFPVEILYRRVFPLQILDMGKFGHLDFLIASSVFNLLTLIVVLSAAVLLSDSRRNANRAEQPVLDDVERRDRA